MVYDYIYVLYLYLYVLYLYLYDLYLCSIDMLMIAHSLDYVADVEFKVLLIPIQMHMFISVVISSIYRNARTNKK